MNKLRVLFLFLFLLFASPPLAAAGLGAHIEIVTKGLVCPACGIGIKKHFSRLQSVKKVTLDTKKQITYLYLNKDGEITDKLIRTTMHRAGYEAAKIKRNRIR